MNPLPKPLFDDQKVLFRYEGKIVGELEMRNDSLKHYREVRFNMNKKPFIHLLDAVGFEKKSYTKNVILYGKTIKYFGKWEDGT